MHSDDRCTGRAAAGRDFDGLQVALVQWSGLGWSGFDGQVRWCEMGVRER